MQTVNVDRVPLLAKLRANRDNHRALFEKAQDGYRKAVIEELDKMLLEAREGKRIRQSVGLKAPIDQTPEYDRAIAMLEMSVDDTVSITQQDFTCFVLDQWSWAAQVSALNTRYSTGGKWFEGEVE